MASVRSPGRCPTHPGALLREDILPAVAKSKTEIAALLGISRETLYRLLREEQSVTAELAARLGKLFGNGPGLWLRMQAAHDEWRAQQMDVSAIPTLSAA
ncbi:MULTISPECIES: HigA family addiction module antitoxin [unclassified Alsobacter]|jgi:addiction module HigA family antidote|uniref:HigA family addiction module antitoxin n=1 Tax=Alsobacter sp. KACC 23698 TaxID=3149229 RepID=A0AAU7JLE5_9HYPH